MPANPAQMLSTPMAATSTPTSGPAIASQTNMNWLSGPAKAPMISARIRPRRTTAKPPRKTPAMVAMTPNTFRTSAIWVLLNPRSR